MPLELEGEILPSLTALTTNVGYIQRQRRVHTISASSACFSFSSFALLQEKIIKLTGPTQHSKGEPIFPSSG